MNADSTAAPVAGAPLHAARLLLRIENVPFSRRGIAAVFGMFAAATLAGLAASRWRVETRNRALEEIAP